MKLMFTECLSLTSVYLPNCDEVSGYNPLGNWFNQAGTQVSETPTLTLKSGTTTDDQYYRKIATETYTLWAIKAHGASTYLRDVDDE